MVPANMTFEIWFNSRPKIRAGDDGTEGEEREEERITYAREVQPVNGSHQTIGLGREILGGT